MGGMSQRKGSVFERAVVAWLRDRGAVHAERALRAGTGQPTGDIDGLPGVHIECKNTRTWRLAEWADKAAGTPARTWVLIVKRKGVGDVGAAYAITTADQWLALVQAAGWAGQR